MHSPGAAPPPPCRTACRGFTDYTREDFKAYREENRLINDGCHVKLISHKGPLARRKSDGIFTYAARKCGTPQHQGDEELKNVYDVV